MDIKTFVSESLNQIIQGIEEAQSKNIQSSINPTFGRQPQTKEVEKEIEFDIAVTLEKGTESKGGIAVFGGAISVGGQGKTNQSDLSVSRIKFSVPVAFRLKVSRPSAV